ncbi:DUF3331 domain-containing protein [Caballeronia insecticola]|nr:DUF3331 domain-containing protein [Caballeronia insecticola]
MSKVADDLVVSRALLDLIFPMAAVARRDQLASFKTGGPVRRRSTSRKPPAHVAPSSRDIHVAIIERITSCTMTVRWSDPMTGRYDEQIWRTAKARWPSFCSLTGLPIHPRDEVFKPVSQGKIPFNCNQMILVSEARRFLGEPVKVSSFATQS